ncbi:flagellar protein FlaG [Hydrogenovibrio thermophilus]|uniref:Flagellar protein FlaG n=1 Tax=Hydrogenovibrio thermophilus TaxID=265883 RepID=A0A410H422_9GAMM|nr:flagellar protein FlaG [Hydrogenovibrio thermophilus]QAB15570.1 hypothetical protein EPV75_07770 [Hydrogenovibrio thermophilus]
MNTLGDELLETKVYVPATASTSKVANESTTVGSTPPLDKQKASSSIDALNKKPSIDAPQNSSSVTVSEAETDRMMENINAMLDNLDNYMMFEKDDVTGRNIYSLIDKDSKEVIKQFPSDEFLSVSRRLVEYLEAELSKEVSSDDKIGNIVSNIV